LFNPIFNHVSDGTHGVEVHFENKDGGFFLKHVPAEQSTNQETGGDSLETLEADDPLEQEEAILSQEHFTVLQSSQPASIRATYGPFSTKQTVPARYIVPDALDAVPSNSPLPFQPDLVDADLYAHNLDISAHLVTPQIPRDAPVLRVLFHTGQQNAVGGGGAGAASAAAAARRQQRVCIVLYAALGERPSEAAACSPGGDDGVCLAQLTVPANWWPPLPGPDYFSEPPHETKPVNKVCGFKLHVRKLISL